MTTNNVSPDLMAQLAQVFAANREARERRADTAWQSMTVREQHLVREAAVMGYVQGVRHGPYRDRIPDGFAITAEVLIACDSFSDLYPFLAAACDGRRKRGPRGRRPGREAGGMP